MKLALYKARGNWMDRAIRAWMRGPYSHVELVVGDAPWGSTCFAASNREGAVRLKTMVLDADTWDIVDLGSDGEAEARQWFLDRIGAKYDWIGILGFIFRPIRGSRSRYFCSEAVAAALGFAEPWRMDPNQLHAVALKMTELKVGKS